MSDFCEVKIEGLDELQDKLKAIAGDQFRKVVRDSTQKGAEVIRSQAETNAPSGPGKDAIHLKQNIIAKATSKSGTWSGEVSVQVGPDQDAWYGRLVEFGHDIVNRFRNTKVKTKAKNAAGFTYARIASRKVIGKVVPHPFLRPAFDSKKDEAAETVISELKQWLARFTNGNS